MLKKKGLGVLLYSLSPRLPFCLNKLAALRLPPVPVGPCIPMNERESVKRGGEGVNLVERGCVIASVCIILNKESEGRGKKELRGAD